MVVSGLKIMAALDGSSLDLHLIRQAAVWADALGKAELHFLHVREKPPVAKSLRRAHPEIFEEATGAEEEKLLSERLSERLAGRQYQFHFKEGKNFPEIMSAVAEFKIDLLLLGLKPASEGSGLVSHRLANQSPCSLLLVPAALPAELSRILVPTDFSRHAELALDWAQALGHYHKSEIQLLHFYHVPGGYLKNAGSRRELAGLIKKHSEQEKNEAGPIHRKLSCQFRENDGQAERATLAYADENQYDLLVLGSKGRTAAATLLLGSFAEKLFKLNRDKGLLIVKQPEENEGFFRALMQGMGLG